MTDPALADCYPSQAGERDGGLALSSLVSSRILHDLISPVGAISNGLELLALSDGGGAEERELISDCAESASATIAFLRVAFGARAEEETTNLSEVLELAARYFALRKISVERDENIGASIAYGPAKAMLLAAMAGASALPYGGVLRLRELSNEEPIHVKWSVEGDLVRLRASTEPMLVERPALSDVTPGEAHIYLLWRTAEKLGVEPRWRMVGEQGEISLT